MLPGSQVREYVEYPD